MKNAVQFRSLKFLRLWLTLGWLLAAIIVFFSLSPSKANAIGFSHSDKLLHVFAYGLLMYYFCCVYLPGPTYLKLGIGFVALGLFLEVIQGLLGYRDMEYWDMAANLTGVLTGWILSKTRLSSLLVYIENRWQACKKDNI